ncbi:MAG: GNAT family N-acetyltransferase [Acidobacteria bacterium]|nr:GNAT family N-acetyltransferase [Acidobacteriota bacterium]MBI3422818.1 GNAT family N-acetyltransferase [Acidobacteriota bacterium]
MSGVVTIRSAHDSDYAEVAALLHAVSLPVNGVQEHFGDFLVASADAGELVGCVGQERYGDVTLLRSLAVNPAHQGTGLGRELTLELLSAARAYGMREVVLLTNTAASFFQKHFGFAPVERARYDQTLGASVEWTLPRCASAICLMLPLV